MSVSGVEERPPAWKVWWSAARPKTLWAGAAPVVIAAAVAHAYDVFHLPSAAAALVGSLLIQIGTNFANDYFDYVKGADTSERIGPVRATQAGLVSPGAMRMAAILVFTAVLIPGAYIIYRGGWPFAVVGAASIACGILYTAGPFPLGYLGLGDVFVLVFYGPVAVCGTYYLQAGEIVPVAWISSAGPGLLAAALLAVNNLRDLDQDRLAGKKTLAVRFGPRFVRAEYALCLLGGGFVVPLALFGMLNDRWFLVVPLIFFVWGAQAIHDMYALRGAELNELLATTGKLLLIYTILLSAAWLLPG
jgi:1,4-dihydroxy-2-naphthoate octaprenyltransferase